MKKGSLMHAIVACMKQLEYALGMIKKLSNILPRDALLTIYKSFVKLYLDYGDIIYDQLQS